MNELEILIKSIEKRMKEKKIKKKDMAKDLKMSPTTITNVFNSYEGSFATLKRILYYVNNK